MQSTVLIYLSGTGPIRFPVEIDKLKLVKVIAADSGIELEQKHNTHVDVLVGDLDSASEHCILIAEKDGTEIIEFDIDKDFTDFELAVAEAKTTDAERLIIIGGGGLRSDHLLANISVLAGSHTEEFIVDIYFENEILKICRNNQPRNIYGKIGSLVSLIPVNGDVQGVTTNNLKWNLENEKLSSSRALGISNVLLDNEADIEIKSGSLLIVQQI